MKKVLITILVILAVIAGGFVLGRNVLARMAVIKGVKAATGMAVDIQSVNIGLMSPGISVSGLKVYNPEGFGDRLLADIPEIFVDCDLSALFQNRVHLRQLTIDVSELDILVDSSGKLNVNSLALFLPKPGTGKAPEVKIDELRVKLGKVLYKGSFAGVSMKEGTFTMGMDERFQNVTDPKAVAAEILKRVLDRAGIANLANFGQATGLKEQVQQTADDLIQKAKDSLQGILPK